MTKKRSKSDDNTLAFCQEFCDDLLAHDDSDISQDKDVRKFLHVYMSCACAALMKFFHIRAVPKKIEPADVN